MTLSKILVNMKYLNFMGVYIRTYCMRSGDLKREAVLYKLIKSGTYFESSWVKLFTRLAGSCMTTFCRLFSVFEWSESVDIECCLLTITLAFLDIISILMLSLWESDQTFEKPEVDLPSSFKSCSFSSNFFCFGLRTFEFCFFLIKLITFDLMCLYLSGVGANLLLSRTELMGLAIYFQKYLH